jgi:hypothetical protein
MNAEAAAADHLTLRTIWKMAKIHHEPMTDSFFEQEKF